jgi:Integrase core domain
MAESFFATLKTELYYRRVWPTKKAARIEVGKWIEDRYNGRRPHASIGQITPWPSNCNTHARSRTLKKPITRVHETWAGPTLSGLRRA